MGLGAILEEFRESFEKRNDERVPDEAMKLLPLVDSGTIRMAKFSNPGGKGRATGVVVSYCLDEDPSVAAALGELGWEIRWKFNHQTFGEMGRV